MPKKTLKKTFLFDTRVGIVIALIILAGAIIVAIINLFP